KDIKEITKLASRLAMLESKIKLYEKELINLRSTRYTMESIVGVSDVISKLKMEALKATSNKFPVLITGDSGTGKELFAQAIHHASPRKLYPFIRLNCAAIPGELLESELFGYEKGAFTGANPKGKPGKFELAHRGSIFLDEIGELPLKMQPKLLRVLEEKEFERIGGMSIIKSDFRLIAATNRNLEDMVAKGLFRRDLFYRLNVIPLQIPPLRERREDIIPLARHLLKKMTQDAAFAETHMDEAVETLLCNYDWKGNVRELTNVLEQALSSVEGDTIRPDNLPFYLCGPQKNQGSIDVSTLKQAQIKAEKEAIQTALEKAGHNKTRAAEMLGIHRTLLYKKADKYAISLAPEK
ncbi:MAG: sigma 54-interacting transcriptional regulator, partial [Proteobacteria bacterium]|nr:sigma 54-interacting transcriptional regulator [Pseudomonadota bacterium]